MKILVAVESEYFANEQADFITKHEWPKDTIFKLVHVVEPASSDTEELDTGGLLTELAQVKQERGAKLVKSTAQKIGLKFKDAKIMEEVVVGHPKDWLLNEIESWEADIVVVGSHGRREYGRSTIGSISSAILSYAKCSVIVVRPYGLKKPEY